MTEAVKKRLLVRPTQGMFMVHWEDGGELPKEFKNHKFTTEKIANQFINNYLVKKEKEAAKKLAELEAKLAEEAEAKEVEKAPKKRGKANGSKGNKSTAD